MLFSILIIYFQFKFMFIDSYVIFTEGTIWSLENPPAVLHRSVTLLVFTAQRTIIGSLQCTLLLNLITRGNLDSTI